MGRYSIMILVIHTLIIGTLALAVEKAIGLTMSKWATYWFTLFICWLLIPIMKKYLPYVTAQKDWFSFAKLRKRITIHEKK